MPISRRLTHKFKRLGLTFVVLVFLLSGVGLYLLLPQNVSAEWYDGGWSLRKRLTINRSQVVGSHTNFPLLVSITDTALVTHAQSDGDDILFTSADGRTRLDHVLESYNSTTGALVAWVRLPTLSSNVDTDVYMYFGNSTIGSQASATTVWNSNFRGVYHFSEGSGTTASDQTTNANNLTLNTSSWITTAKIAGGWNGQSNNWLTRADDNDFDFAAADNFSISMWVKSDSATNPGSTQWVVNKSLSGGTQQAGYAVYFNTSGQICFGVDDDTTWGPDDQACSSTDVYDGNWQYVTATKTGTSRIDIYVNGVSAGSDTSLSATATLANSRDLIVGDRQAADASDEFAGDLDEFRIAATNLSADWFLTEYNNQNSPSTFLTLSSTEEQMATVLNWKFDEGYGSTVNDSTSTGLHGTVGASTAEPERRSEDLCLFGKCLRFDGVDDFVSRTYSSATDSGLDPGTEGFAVSLWFRHGSSISQNENLVARYNNGGYDIYMNTSGQLCFRVAQNGTALASGDQVCTTNSFSDSNWYFLKALWDPDSSTNKQSIYISSSLEANSTSITQTGSKSGSSPTLYLGIGSNGTSNPFGGYIDDLKIYRENFSDAKTRADTASANYTEGASAIFGTKDIRESLTNGLVGYWRLEEESEGTCPGGTLDACDLSGSNNHAEWEGTPRSDTGKFGNNLNFDTNEDYLSVADSNSLDTDSRFTLSAWVKPNDTATNFLQIQRDGATTTATATAQSSITFAHTVNTQSNQVLVVTSAIEHTATTRTISSITYNGVGLTSAVGTTNSNRRVEIWYLLNPSTGTNNVTITYSGTTDDIMAGATNLYNVAQQAPTQTATNTNDSANTTVTFTPTNDMSGVIEVIVNGTPGSNTLFPNSNQTEIYEVSTTSARSAANFSYAYENTSTSLTEGATIIDNQAHVAAIFAPASASPGNVVLVGKGRDAYQLEMNSSYQVQGYLNNTAQVTGQLTSGSWNHVLLAFDSINAVLYINGELVQSTAINQATGSNNDSLIIGQNFDGNLDDIRIYNRPFSEYEVRYFYDWAPEPVTYFNFDEGQGSTLNNKGFNAIDATLTCVGGGCANPTWSPGKYGKGLQFSSANGNYALFDEPGLTIDPREPFSISLWVYPDDIVSGAYETLLCDETGVGFCLYLTGTSTTAAKVDLCVDGGTCASNPDTNNSVVTERKWSHIVVTYNGGGNTYLMYVDGIDQLADATAPSVTDVTANDFYIGMFDPFGTPDGCNCRIDDIRIYNYVRNQKQVIADLNLGHPPIGGPVGAPIAYWNFDEGTGSTVYSQGNCVSVCNANYSNFSDPPTSSSGRTPEGRYDKALRFDGSNDHVNIGNDYQLRIPNQITLSAWIRPEANDRTIISKYDTPSTASYRLHINSSNQIEFSLSSNGSTINTLTSTDTVAVDGSTWYHVVATYDGANMKLFIDGQADNTLARTGGIFEGGENVIIGGSYQSNSLGRYFDGIMDEVRIYNYALNDSETGQEFFKGSTAILGAVSTESDGLTPSDSSDRSYCVPGDTSTCRAPRAYLQLNEKSGTTWTDSSGFSNSATIGGTAPTRRYSKYNYGVFFNNNNQTFINIDDDSPFDFTTGGLTMMGWFKINSWQTNGADIFGKGTAYYLEQNAGTGALNFVTSNLSNVTLSSTTNVTDGQWRHIAAVWDGSNKYLYIDGQIDVSAAATGTLPTNNTDVRIGDPSNTGSGTFSAEVDEIKVYDYGRTVQQINWDINRGKPASWWKFDDCSGSTAYDAGGNAANATLSIGGSGTYTSAGNCNSGSTSESWAVGRTGQFNSAIALDGTDDKVITTNTASVRNLNQVTVSAWLYPTAYNANGSSILFEPTNSSNSTARLELVLNSDGTVTFRGRAPDGDSLTTWVTTTRTVPLNQWSNVVGIFNSVSDTHYVYINKFPTSASVSEASFTDSDPAAPPYIGAISSGSNTYNFTGLIDDIRIYPYALTELQVDVLAAGDGAAVFGPTQGLPE